MISALLASTLTLLAGVATPVAEPTPVLVFIQTDPWKMVIGSDTPRVAVYDTGEVIFVKHSCPN